MKNIWIYLGLFDVGVVACGTLALLYVLPLDLSERSPVQPIAFSHKLHAGINGIPCLYCHRYAPHSRLAGIPSLADCRACHIYIAADTPEIRKVLAYWDKQEPIAWVRVNSLPDHVYFPHMMHIRARIDCTHCHGQVAAMERISRTATLKMGWCLGCHRQHKASIDCWTCHI